MGVFSEGDIKVRGEVKILCEKSFRFLSTRDGTVVCFQSEQDGKEINSHI